MTMIQDINSFFTSTESTEIPKHQPGRSGKRCIGNGRRKPTPFQQLTLRISVVTVNRIVKIVYVHVRTVAHSPWCSKSVAFYVNAVKYGHTVKKRSFYIML